MLAAANDKIKAMIPPRERSSMSHVKTRTSSDRDENAKGMHGCTDPGVRRAAAFTVSRFVVWNWTNTNSGPLFGAPESTVGGECRV
jgi:hypothetical protein